MINLLVGALAAAGIDATNEYPGYASVAVPGSADRVCIGTANGYWGATIMTPDGEELTPPYLQVLFMPFAHGRASVDQIPALMEAVTQYRDTVRVVRRFR